MQITRAADYAVRVMLHLATLPPGARANRTELARTAGAPASFVAKVLQRLVDTQLVRSRPGRRGGFELARAANELSLLDIVTAVEGPMCLNECLPGGDGCPRSSWCTAHPVWRDAQAALQTVLGAATLDRLRSRIAPPPVESAAVAAHP